MLQARDNNDKVSKVGTKPIQFVDQGSCQKQAEGGDPTMLHIVQLRNNMDQRRVNTCETEFNFTLTLVAGQRASVKRPILKLAVSH